MSARSKAAKIAISIDQRVLAQIERARGSTGESRSAFVSRALLKLLRAEQREKRIARYVEAYREQPDRDEDVRSARKLAARALSSVEW